MSERARRSVTEHAHRIGKARAESQLQPAATGASAPLGATLVEGGCNFSVCSKRATGIELLLFDRVDDARPARLMRFDPAVNRTSHYWHAFVPAVILNAYAEALDFELPAIDGGGPWRRWIDTALDSPEDIVPWTAATAVSGAVYRAEPHSVVALYANVPSAEVVPAAPGAPQAQEGDGS